MTELVNIPSDGWMLHGIVHLPPQNPARRVGVVLFHENYNTKFGTHRLFRDLADTLAQSGFFVLRYDNRGLCDSAEVSDVTFADRLADARAALAFFRLQYKLDTMVGWGLCLGATVAVHCAAEAPNRHEKIEGLVLCSVLADPGIVSLPEFGYETVQFQRFAQEVFLRGNLLRKLWNAPRKLKSHSKRIAALARRYLRREPKELGRLKAAISRVGSLVAGYDGPCLLIFGEKDTYYTDFVERVNPGDRLGLRGKRFPPAWALIKDADHVFASREKTAELFRCTLDWVRPFLEGHLPGPADPTPERRQGISVAEVV